MSGDLRGQNTQREHPFPLVQLHVFCVCVCYNYTSEQQPMYHGPKRILTVKAAVSVRH